MASPTPPSGPTPHTVTSSSVGVVVRRAPPPSNGARGGEARYLLGKEIGRGGLGRVALAEDTSLGRVVAIKELHNPSPSARARFEREIELTARLQHPAIVPVYDAGTWSNDEPFYAMRLVEGGTLKDAIERARTFPERLALLPHVVTAADAIAYAHRQNIVHRDIKPSNVLVGEHGETLVVDWGAAKSLDSNDLPADEPRPLGARGDIVTIVGAVIGTPAFMAPEQARGEDAGKAADVYALGALLYNVLAGAAPYPGADRVDVVLARPPVPLRQLVPNAPEPLLAIVELAMARDPRARYPSAGEVAADLRRFQLGQLVGAHRYTVLERFVRTVRRHKAAVAVAALALAVLAIVIVISVDRVIRERDVATARTRELTLVQASTSLDRDPTAALAWLKTLDGAQFTAEASAAQSSAREGTRAHDDERLRAIAADAIARGVSLEVIDLDVKIEHLATSPDGRRVFIATDRALLVWDLDERRIVARYDADDPLEVRFTNDGARAVTRGRQGTLRVFPGVRLDAARTARASLLGESDRPIATFVGDRGWTNDLALSPDGERGVLASADGVVRLFDLERVDHPADIVTTHTGGTESVDVSADGTLVASAGSSDRLLKVHALASLPAAARGDAGAPAPEAAVAPGAAADAVPWSASITLTAPARIVRFIDGALFAALDDGDVVRIALAEARADGSRTLTAASLGGSMLTTSLGRRAVRIDEVALSPDRTHAAVGYHDGVIVLFDFTNATRRELRGHTNELIALAFSSDGARLASGGLDRTVRVWSTAHGTSRALVGHRGVIESVAFGAGDEVLVSGSQDGTVRVWDVHDDGRRAFAGHSEDIYMVRASPDGRALATAGKDHTVRLWDRVSGDAQTVGELPHIAYCVAFSPDGKWLAASGYGPTVDVWPLVTTSSGTRAVLEQHLVLTGHEGSVWRIEFSRDSRSLVSASADGTARAWSTSSFETLRAPDATGPGTADAASVNGAKSGRLLHAHDSEGALFVTTSPDSRWAATAGMDKTARISSLDEAAPSSTTRVLKGHDERLLRVAFSPDSSTLATGSWDRTIRTWDVATGAPERTLAVHEGRVRSLLFLDDTRLASGADDDSVRITDVRTGSSRLLGKHAAYVRELEVSPDGKLLASMGWDESVRLWDTESGALVGLERKDAVLMSVVFTPDARDLVIVGYPKLVDVKPTASAASVPLANVPSWLARQTHAIIDERGELSSARPLTTRPPTTRAP